MIRGHIKNGTVGLDEPVNWPEGAEVSVQRIDSGQPHAAIELVDTWLKDDSNYDETAWPELKKELDQDRLAARKFFDG